jgi:CelD/BcsL family acetyltransferase involved in cellulose biosynthesis
MKVSLVVADQLADAQLDRWSQRQAANPELRSPFFHPLYTRVAATVLASVEVAIVEEDDGPGGFFPFQRTSRNVGIPVGGSLNDFQGVVAQPGFEFDAASLVRSCRLSGLRFTQLLASQRPFRPYAWFTHDSPSLDLREGFEGYHRERREAGSTFLSRTRDKRRVAIRDLGPLRFEADAEDPRVLESLVDWKSRQYRRIRAANQLARPGVLDFLRRLLALRSNEFRGVLSAMYFGDQLAAVHLGMRCGNILHLWFPTYNEELAKYSPGSIYFMEQARAAEEMGIHRIDLGCGNERFKLSLRSFGTPVVEGAVGFNALVTSVRRTWLCTKQWIQASRFQSAARTVVRGIRGIFLHEPNHDSSSRQPR